MNRHRLPLACVLAVVLPAVLAHAQPADDRYSIMTPEPWVAPKYRSPRSAPSPVPRAAPEAMPRASAPPSIYVPEAGRVLPNMPAPAGAGPGGSETYQDRAARCAHQAGVYGDAAGNRVGYIGACINQ